VPRPEWPHPSICLKRLAKARLPRRNRTPCIPPSAPLSRGIHTHSKSPRPGVSPSPAIAASAPYPAQGDPAGRKQRALLRSPPSPSSARPPAGLTPAGLRCAPSKTPPSLGVFHSPPTCSKRARTCARSRSCWGTRTSPRRRSTCTWPSEPMVLAWRVRWIRWIGRWRWVAWRREGE